MPALDNSMENTLVVVVLRHFPTKTYTYNSTGLKVVGNVKQLNSTMLGTLNI